jgi:hypothetical protein
LLVDALDDAQGGAAVTVAGLVGRVGVALAAEDHADPELEPGIGFVLDELVEALGVAGDVVLGEPAGFFLAGFAADGG